MTSVSADHPLLSVDLGTLRTSAALRHGDADPVMVSLGASSSVPATVALEGGHIVIGEVAEAVLAAHPDRGVRELKRRFGDTTPVVLDGKAFTADALTAEVLTAVANSAGVDPAATSLVLSHPTGWHEYKRELLEATGTRAGFANVETISEAEAAVRPFIRSGRLAAGATVAVYDLGGTFEASVVGITDQGTRVLGQAQTLERLGGDVLDQVVFRHVTEALGGTLQQLDRSDPAVRTAVAALRAECAAAKERLSSDGETAIAVVAPGLDTRVRMTRDEFETAARPLVNDTLTALDRAIASAGIAATDLAAVVLAGGGSQVPVVAEMVAGHVGRPLLVDRPAAAVAVGAAMSLLVAAPAAAAPVVATIVAPVAVAAASIVSPSDTPTIASAPREPAMSDQPSTESTAPAAASAGAGGRSIPTPPPPPGKKVSPKVTTALGGLAALAAAVTAAVFYGDDVVNAFDGPDGEANAAGIADAPADETRTADRAEREAGDDSPDDNSDDNSDDSPDDSMDAFDTVDPTDAPAAGAAVGTPLAPPAPEQASFSRPAPQATHQQQRSQLDDDGPTVAPRQAPAAAGAAAASAATAAAAAAAPDAGPDAGIDPGFEASRSQLLARLEAFEAPEGTSPEDAAALKAELRETIENFDPRPGQSASDAMADLRDQFDETMQDFTQDQQIEALIEETQRDNEEEAAADAPATDPVVPPVDADGDGTTDDEPAAAEPVDVAAADEPAAEEPAAEEPADDAAAEEPAAEDAADAAADDGVATLDTGLREIDPGFIRAEVEGESSDRDHRGEIDASLLEDAGVENPDLGDRPDADGPGDGPGMVRAEPNLDLLEPVTLIDADALAVGQPGVFEDPDAGGEVTSRFDDGFEDLIQVAVVSDPDMGGEATPGSVVGGEAVPQIRATVDPAAVRPTMMSDLGDDTYDQVRAEAEGDPAGILIGMDQGVVAAPAEVDAGFLLPAVDTGPELDMQIPEPESIMVEIDVPISALEEADFEADAPGLAEDLHSDITPNAPDNLQFGGG